MIRRPPRSTLFPTRRSSDLNEQTVRTRMEEYRAKTAPILPFYEVRGLVRRVRSEEHTSELQSQSNLVCRLLLEKKKQEPLLSIFSDAQSRQKPHDLPRCLLC